MPEVLAPSRTAEAVQDGGSVQEGAPANAKGAGAAEGTRPRLQDYDVVVNADSLPRVATYLRDVHGYAYLSNITAVDYILDGLIEVIYHFFSIAGGGPQTVRVRVPRERPIIPTLTGEWPGANLQEREAFDLYGVQFPGHPYLRRIYMWDEFQGFPMRKDFPKTGDKYTHETGGE
jgi:NADH-quinone oxidoreductase subunit C